MKILRLYYHRVAQQKLQGGALYVSVLCCCVLACLLLLFMLVGNYNQRQVNAYLQATQLNLNLASAFQAAGSSYFTPEKNYTWLKNQVNDDSIRVKKRYWGAYLLVCAETKNRHHYLSQAGFYGTCMSADTGLMLADNSRPLGLSGHVVLKAPCYLPKNAVKSGLVEGQTYMADPGNEAFIRQAPANIPSPDADLIKGIKQERELDLRLDSLVADLSMTHEHPFNAKTLVWETTQSSLSHLRVKNNIKLICGEVEIDSSAHLENVLLICKKVHFKSGFTGRLHVLAQDSISMEAGCTFRYPSSFVLLNQEAYEGGFKSIQLNRDCIFFGGILALSEKNKGQGKVFVKLNARSEVNGFVFSSDYVHLEGQINATVIAAKAFLKTSSAVYENQAMGCEIDPKKYAQLLAVPILFRNRHNWLCCEKIEEG